MQRIQEIVNLSSFNLQPHHISLLRKGLKHCPTPPPPNPGDLWRDLDSYHQSLRRICYFSDKEKKQSDVLSPQGTSKPFKHRLFAEPSTWKPPPAPKPVERMIEANLLSFNERAPETASGRHNLTPLERRAINELHNNEDIVIRRADKGGAVVIWNRNDYLREGYRQLCDSNFYTRLDHCPTKDFNIEIGFALQTMLYNNEIDETVHEYLTSCNLRTSEFYLLPKIHKGTSPVPGRPIISGNSSPTERISKFVDFFLKPHCSKLRSFVKDTTHFLQLLQEFDRLHEDTLLVTMDVTSLYTNIPNQGGLEAARSTLNRHRRQYNIKPTNASLINLLELVLTKNNFTFNGRNYLQVGGTAMGTRVAPSYAILYMGDFEDRFVYTYHKQPLLYLRYIDDIFLLWQHGADELSKFVTHLNTANQHIRFTCEHSADKIPFLDTLVCIRNNHLVTDLYTKPTDTHNYLLFDSAHPQKCKTSIPHSQFLRIRRICSDPQDYKKHVRTLSVAFLRRGYPAALLARTARTIKHLQRRSLLGLDRPNKKKATKPETVHLISPYHPHHRALPRIAHSNWHLLDNHPTIRYLSNRRLICGLKRPSNLRDKLTRAKIQRLARDNILDPFHEESTATPNTPQTPYNPDWNRGYCLAPNICRYCPRLNKSGYIRSTTTGRQHRCMSNITCCSSNLIYVITCVRCKIQYVGQTLTPIKQRFGQHFSDITGKTPHLKPVSNHFTSHGHNGYTDMTITVLEYIRQHPQSLASIKVRHRRETDWIHTLRTLHPRGLNKEDPKPYTSHHYKRTLSKKKSKK